MFIGCTKATRGFPLKISRITSQSLLKAVAKDITRVQHDCKAYGHDLAAVKDHQSDEEPGSKPLSWLLLEARELWANTST
jgi:hypothetical protein